MNKWTKDEVMEIERILRKHSTGLGSFDYEAADMLREYAAHLAAQAEWPSEEDVATARDAYVSSCDDCHPSLFGMRAALQSVRPPVGVVSDSWTQDPDCIPRPIIAACRVAIQREFGISGTDGYYKRILEKVFKSLAPSRHAPTKD